MTTTDARRPSRRPRRDARPGRPATALHAAVAALLTVLLAVTGTLATAVVPGPGTATATAETSDGPVDVTLTSLTPETLRPGDTLTVVATLTNTSGADITSPVARLSLARNTLDTRNSIASWSTAERSSTLGTTLLTTPLPDTLAAGATTTVELTVAADELNLRTGYAAWGPRGLAVSVTGVTDGYSAVERLGVLRTYVVWYPLDDTAVQPLSVSVVVPVVGPPADPLAPERTTEALREETAPGGRLESLLAGTQAVPGVTWAVDPALVEQLLADDTPTGDTAGTTTTGGASWAQRFLEATAAGETYALPRYDQDISAYAAAGLPLPVQGPLGEPFSGWRTDLSWPADDAPATDVLDLAVRSGAGTVVVGSGTFEPVVELPYTATGLTSVTTPSGTAAAVLPDATLTTLLLDAPGPVGTTGTTTASTPAAARQRITAELAVISRERPAQARHVVITAPRDWSPGADVLQAQLNGITAVPWATIAPLSALLAGGDPGIPRTPVPADTTALGAGAVDGDTLRQVGRTAQQAQTFAKIVTDPGALTRPVTESAVAVGSVAWRGDPDGRALAVEHQAQHLAALRGAVSVVTGSDFNLISTGSEIPVQVRNDLGQAVTLLVELEPDSPRLVADTRVPVTVPAGGDASVTVPVRGIGSGDVTTEVHILSADGTLVAEPATFKVRVRADWENRGTLVVAVLLLVLLGAGIWRTVHRGRSERRASAAVVEQLEHSEQTGELDALIDAQDSGTLPGVDPTGAAATSHDALPETPDRPTTPPRSTP
ncbi:DUF6049 family protein [Sanguibacter suaedae]|uniref:Glycoprotein n=1 Tax=Sanguibacter suaedae TaxID=2795737 RepID=A0A934I9U0_9MICO|nr:DUF6049 family protein [Sanguibacter suaedae]MBI9114830.1 hypothetical protein [Sanguibacter suaedae]